MVRLTQIIFKSFNFQFVCVARLSLLVQHVTCCGVNFSHYGSSIYPTYFLLFPVHSFSSLPERGQIFAHFSVISDCLLISLVAISFQPYPYHQLINLSSHFCVLRCKAYYPCHIPRSSWLTSRVWDWKFNQNHAFLWNLTLYYF